MSRRRYLERSSSGGVAVLSACAASALPDMSLSLHLLVQGCEKLPSLGELAPFGLRPVIRGAGFDAAAPALGDEFVQQDENPAQAEERKQRREPRRERAIVVAIEPHR